MTITDDVKQEFTYYRQTLNLSEKEKADWELEELYSKKIDVLEEGTGVAPTSPTENAGKNMVVVDENILKKVEGFSTVLLTGAQTEQGKLYIANNQGIYEVDVADFAENGYLECVDDLRPDSEDYFQAAFDSLLINGKMYSIPFDFTIRLAAYSPEVFTDNLETFSLQDMMEKVKSGNTEILSYDRFGQETSPYWIVMNYGLYDESNKAFIDWEQKLSHLNEEPFLEFAKEYGRQEKVSSFPIKKLKDGPVSLKMDERMEADFYNIVNNAKPGRFRADDIADVVYEELQLYFEGSVSAKEAAGKLHERVQLYLNEQK